MGTRFFSAVAILSLFAPGAAAQERLTLADAVSRTSERHPALRAAREGERMAAAGVDLARAAWLPRVDYTEAWQRSDQPVFVFGTLLAQSRFGPENFAFDALNNPDAISNLRGSLTVQQNVFDYARPARISAANVGRDSASLAATVRTARLAWLRGRS